MFSLFHPLFQVASECRIGTIRGGLKDREGARSALSNFHCRDRRNGSKRKENKIGNPSNGPAGVTWSNMFCLDGYYGIMYELVTGDHSCSQVLTFVCLDSMNWSLLRSRTSTKIYVMVIMAL